MHSPDTDAVIYCLVYLNQESFALKLFTRIIDAIDRIDIDNCCVTAPNTDLSPASVIRENFKDTKSYKVTRLIDY